MTFDLTQTRRPYYSNYVSSPSIVSKVMDNRRRKTKAKLLNTGAGTRLWIVQFQLNVRQRLHGTGSLWNRYKIGTDSLVFKHTGPGGSGTDRFCCLAPNGSAY